MKLLIAHTSETLQRALEQQMAGEFEILTCHNGEIALALLEEHKPTILVIQDCLYRLDGLRVLLTTAYRPPVILFLTAGTHPSLLARLQDLEVSAVLRMPTVHAVVGALVGAMQQLPQLLPPIPMQRMLQELGFQPSLDGYRQLCQAAELLLQNPRGSLSRDIYPAIAPQNPGTVEHNIRHAIENAWKKGNPAAWQRYFPGARRHPKTKAFLFALLQDHWNRGSESYAAVGNGTVHG